jgi:hypothetical protein
LDVLLKECRDPTSRIAISYPSYYEKYAVNTFDNISQKLVAWQQLEHNDKQFVEYSIINRMFTTTIGIIDEDEDDEFFAKPMDVMIERYIYIQFDMNYENMVFIGKKRRLAFNKVLGGFQKYGFAIEQGFPYSHGMDTVYVSKTHLLGYTDLMDTNLFSKAKQYSKKACLSLLLEMHDQVFRALVS